MAVTTIDQYISALPEDRQSVLTKLRDTLRANLPKGYIEEISYGMPAFVVPHSIYPKGYHCDPKMSLPFISFASQKNFIALYHMGIYADPELLDWFVAEYPKHVKSKLDMGKSCIRFKKPQEIPFDLIAQLAQRMTVSDWVNKYEKEYRK